MLSDRQVGVGQVEMPRSVRPVRSDRLGEARRGILAGPNPE